MGEHGAALCSRVPWSVGYRLTDQPSTQTVLITCLPTVQIVKNLYQEILSAGPLPSLAQDRLFIDTSTIDPQSSRDIAESVRAAGHSHFIDAPMSGGVVGASAGSLSFMFGAPDSVQLVERVQSVLLTMGKKTWHMGPPGAGVCSKLANNYLLSITNIAAAEALNMGLQAGLDPKRLSDLIQSSTGRCWFLEANNPVPGVDEHAPSSKGYEPGGTVNIVKKDLGLAIAGAKASGASLVLAEKALEVYQTVAEVDGDKDFSIVYQWLKKS